MTIAAILSSKGRDVVRVLPDASIGRIALLLAERRIGAVLVVDRDLPVEETPARLIAGIVSERDIVRALSRAGFGGDVLDMSAAQLMTEMRYTIPPSASLAQAARIMTNARVRHLPVVEEERLAGIISIGDVVKARLDELAREVEDREGAISSGERDA